MAIAVLPLTMLSSCDHSYLDELDNIQDYTYSPVVAFPLVNASISLDDLIDVGDFGEIDLDEENMVTMVYKGQLVSIPASNIFSVTDQSQVITYDNIVPAGSEGMTLPPKVFLITFDNNEILTYISFLEGFFRVSAQASQLAQDGYHLEATFRILNSYDNQGLPVNGTVSLGNPAEVDLTGSRIEFENLANFFLVEYQLFISGNGTPDNAPYTIAFSQEMTGLEYDLIKGYFDQISFPVGNTSIALSLFKNAAFGSMLFENPTIEFTIENSFGAEIDLFVEEFYAATIHEEIIPVTGPGVEEPWRIDASPTHQTPQLTTFKLLDNTNTNLAYVTEKSPKKFHYEASGLLNPDGYDQPTNWIKHDSHLTVDVEVKLPLWGMINFFELQDTTEISVNDLPDELEWAELRMNFSNGFPLNVELDLILLDENNNAIDTLFAGQDNLLDAASVNPATSISEEPRISSRIERLDDTKIENLRKATNLLIQARLNSYDNQNGTTVKILDTYRIGIDLGIRGQVKYVVEF
ncbi:MAG: hypothetical protein EA361_13440 [Bacteroidetes bacterium]|nr:MAG: hypothetical protein EA361_13440 [Bacteroidota bacterium]